MGAVSSRSAYLIPKTTPGRPEISDGNYNSDSWSDGLTESTRDLGYFDSFDLASPLPGAFPAVR